MHMFVRMSSWVKLRYEGEQCQANLMRMELLRSQYTDVVRGQMFES